MIAGPAMYMRPQLRAMAPQQMIPMRQPMPIRPMMPMQMNGAGLPLMMPQQQYGFRQPSPQYQFMPPMQQMTIRQGWAANSGGGNGYVMCVCPNVPCPLHGYGH